MRSFVRLPALALAACAGAWLSARTALPPVGLGPLDPSGAIALVAALLWGWRGAVPVVLAAWIGWTLGGSTPAALPAVLTLALLAQAAAGAAGIRRALGNDVALTEPRDIALFLCIGGPLASAVGTVVAGVALVLAHVVPAEQVAPFALAWWAIQALNACAVAPIALAWVAAPRDGWANRRATVGGALLLAFVLLTLLVTRVARNDQERLRDSFEFEAGAAETLLARHLAEPLNALEAMHSIFTAATEVTRSGFTEAVRPWLEGPGSQRALSYNRRVPRDQIASFEAAVQADGEPNYRVHDRYGSTLDPASRDDVYAIEYIEPAQWHSLLGLNSMSGVARTAVTETVRSGKPIATAAFALANEPARLEPRNIGIVAYYAVYAGTPRNQAERMAAAKGVVTTTLRLDVTMQAVTAGMPAALRLCLDDVSPGAPRQRLAGGPECDAALAGGYTRTSPIEFAGRHWELRMLAPRPLDLPGARVGDAWWVALAGLVATALLGALLLTVSGRATRIQAAMAETRRARVAADAANAAKGDFLANMSHEIRTPMNAIIGMCYLALKSGLAPQQHAYVSKVQRAAQSLLGIIDDILDFSKIEAGKLSVESVPFGLPDVMEHLANLLGLKAEDKCIELVFDEPPGLPTMLIGDPLRLTQVLVNLGGNAVKFTEQGAVVISIEALAVDDASARLRFSVRDTGPGLTEEQRARLFQPFEQADSSTTRRHGGTGLGLTISQHLVRLMGGELDVESTVGTGSVFSFTLPFGIASAEQHVPPLTSLKSLRLLVVDDNSVARHVLADMAMALNMAVETAADGAEALHMAATAAERGRPFDLALIDWKMPGMDGVACAERLTEGRGPRPLVLMTTAFSREQLHEALARSRADVHDILIKPVTPSTLFDACAGALGRLERPTSHVVEREASLTRAQTDLRGARVLLVEDNDINAELAMALLDSAGLVVTLATDGRAALERLARESFDVVLMDCQMPEMDGYEAARRIRGELHLASLPVIAMTANAMSGDRAKALAAGMNDHIAKPIDVAAMFDTLARWIKPQG